jgi:putative membrane protein
MRVDHPDEGQRANSRMRTLGAVASPRATGIERAALAVFYLFTAISVLGFAVFGRNPELVMRLPNAAPVYAQAFTFFPRAHVVIAFATLALLLVRRAGWRWVAAFVALYLISLASELAGTTVGLPFGAYRYTDGLGAKWLGHVPVLIPLSWFFMAVPSWVLAHRALSSGARAGVRGRIATILFGSLVLLAWDLALDPAMSYVTKYWVWGSDGPYYGMPWLNLAGWYLTGLALMGALDVLRAREWSATLPAGWLLGFYAANLLLPLGMIAAAGHWLAVAVSVIGAVATLIAPRLVRPRTTGLDRRGALGDDARPLATPEVA